MAFIHNGYIPWDGKVVGPRYAPARLGRKLVSSALESEKERVEIPYPEQLLQLERGAEIAVAQAAFTEAEVKFERKEVV
jgi:hypothetical protein